MSDHSEVSFKELACGMYCTISYIQESKKNFKKSRKKKKQKS